VINKSESDIARQGAKILGGVTPAGGRLQDIGHICEYVGHAMIKAVRVGVGDDLPDRALRRCQGRLAQPVVEPAQQPGRGLGDPACDCGERTHPGHDRRCAQRQHRSCGVLVS
jgi:hypothetical protein